MTDSSDQRDDETQTPDALRDAPHQEEQGLDTGVAESAVHAEQPGAAAGEAGPVSASSDEAAAAAASGSSDEAAAAAEEASGGGDASVVAADEAVRSDDAKEGAVEASGEAAHGGASDEVPAEAASGSEASAAEGEADAEGGAKKKKRRRRRKKKGATSPGAEAAPAGEGAPSAPKREPHAPFLRFFEDTAGHRAPFSVGEVVAGRVARVEHGAIVVDLFGKATAVVDLFEPREIPIIVESTPEADETEEVAEAAAASEAPAEAEAPPAEAGAVPGPEPVPAASAEATPMATGEAAPVGSTIEAGPEGSPSAAGPEAAMLEAAPMAELSVPEPEAVASSGETGDVVAPVGELSDITTPPASSAEAPAQAEVDGAASAEAEAEAAPEAPAPEPVEPPRRRQIGEIFRGRIGAVAESGHVALINRLVDRKAARARVDHARDEKQRVTGLVFGFNRGGFDVIIEGLRAFCPASGMALEFIDDPRGFVGHKVEFLIQPAKSGTKGVVVSRRSILEREQRKAARERMKQLEVGQVLTGRVTQVREFGAFVDIGDGLEGLVHQSELSWVRGTRPADVAKPGDEVQVKVLEVQQATRKERHGRVSLSVRALLPDPWDAHADVLEEGTARKGHVVRTTDFGAFIELAPGIEGLLHISELGKDLKHAKQVLEDGQEIDVAIDRVDRGQRRISLSRLSPVEMQALAEGTLDLSARPRSLKPGSHVTVIVDRVEHAGVQVHVKGVLGRKGRGFIPNRELGSATQGDKRRAIQGGAEVQVKLVGIDRDGSLRCSIRGREMDEERRAVQDYRREAAKQGLGTFGDLLRAKLDGQDSEST